MKQENGAELLGMNDPRSANIGIIYVTPTDDRRSVLAAILTQEKLGRKQIAVVLPQQNKAFQRPSDFDDLKTIRRKLEAQIVFIAPSGPGPAEFARQRRFAVYSTLESYGRALRDGDESGGIKKGGWLFNRSKPKFIGATPDVASAPPQSSMPGNIAEEDDEDAHTGPIKSAARGAAAFGAGMMAADMFKQGSSSDDPARLFPDRNEDDWDALPPTTNPGPTTAQPDPVTNPPGSVPTPPAAGVVESAKSTNAADNTATPNAGGPKIIELNPVRQKVTAKLSPAELAAANQPPVPPGNANVAGRSTKPRNSGKMAAAAMLGAGAGAASMVAGPPPQRVGAGGNFPPPQRVGGGGNFPPPPGMGGRGGGPGRGPRPRRRYLLLLALLLLLIVASTLGAMAFMNPKMFNQVASKLPGASGATVTITPDSKLISNSYVIQGVPGTPDPAQRQIAVRQLTATAKSDPKTVNTTGHTQTLGVAARGQLTFFNGSFTNSYTVGTNTPIPVGNVSLILDIPAVIPHGSLNGTAGTVTVSAHASTPGGAGNIGAHVADQTCCSISGNVLVKNFNPFTGGQDPQDYKFVQQSDVDGVANPLKNTISAQAQASLQRQLRTGEQFVAQNGNNPCPASVNTDNPVGPRGVNVNSVTVTVTATCNALAYDHAGLQTMVANLLGSKANTDIGASYKLAGQVVMHTKVQNIDQGNVSLLVDAKGIWVAQFSDAQKTEIARAIAGKSVANAQSILGARKDIGHVDIQANGNVLPGDPNQITIVIQNVPGVQDTATPTSGGPGSSTPVNSPGGTQTPLPGKG